MCSVMPWVSWEWCESSVLPLTETWPPELQPTYLSPESEAFVDCQQRQTHSSNCRHNKVKACISDTACFTLDSPLEQIRTL